MRFPALFLLALLVGIVPALAQQIPTPKGQSLDEVRVIGLKSKNGLGSLPEASGAVIYAGKKTEVLVLDSLDANMAQNNPRQILGRIPGANFSETEGAGFPANGIGLRGLNPVQSVEMNVRQNGYNVTADLFGYPETYYLPAMEAVERVEVTRGAASLQFGPQFGGVINYVMRRGNPDKPFELSLRQTGGSYGLFNSFTSVGGQRGKVNYYAYGQYRGVEGWRPNSGVRQATAFGRVEYQATEKLLLAAEYSLLRNKIQMPGGLTDAQFRQDSRQSTRARNWLESPWNIATLTAEYRFSPTTRLNWKTAGSLSSRSLVWRNEDGGPAVPDTIDRATNQYVPREVQRERFRSVTSELRLLTDYRLFGLQNTLAAGVRYYTGRFHRQGGGPGSTAADFDLGLYGGNYEYDLAFTTQNLAPFAETIVRFGDKVSLTPGFRYEYIRSTAQGYRGVDGNVLTTNEARSRHIPLFGIGAQWQPTATTTVYANASQAYRPVDYSALTPFGVTSRIDPNLKDANGYNADLGYRGTVGEWLNFDVGGFYLRYNNRIGLVSMTDPVTGNGYQLRTNVANSVHRGAETYVEISPLKALATGSRFGRVSLFNSLAYVDATYQNGEFKGKQVEYAPRLIERVGLTYGYGPLSVTGQFSYTGRSFGDANNSVARPDFTPDEANDYALVGEVPAYRVWDLSTTYKWGKLDLKAGVNNLTDARYFTRRTDEYPGPGIIPALGRSVYATLGAKF